MQIINKKPLLNECESLYTGSIYENHCYILVNPKIRCISGYNTCFKKVCEKPVCSNYSSITNNNFNNILYMATREECNKIFAVTKHHYQEFNCIHLNVPKQYLKPIKCLFYDSSKKKILIVTDDIIYSVYPNGEFYKIEIDKDTLFKNCCQNICFTAVATFFGITYLAYNQDGVSHIVKLSKDGKIFDSFFINDDIVIHSFMCVKGQLTFLVSKCHKYSYIYITDIECSLTCFEKKDDCCPCIPCPDCCDDCCTNIIESIALIETALAHILNAEGEKIQKAVEIAESTEELLCVNKSVSNLVNDVAFLEHVLLRKLDSVCDDNECK